MAKRKPNPPLAPQKFLSVEELKEQAARLSTEAREVRELLDEVREQIEHALNNGKLRYVADEEPPPRAWTEEEYLAAYEAHEGLLYCCDQPKLRWSGEIDQLSVACISCGFVVISDNKRLPDGDPPGIMLEIGEPPKNK